jgi:uncharacterized protein YegL
MSFNVNETPDNYQQKCCCILVLDTSGSMYGEPIDELNAGLQHFYDEISQDPTTADRLEIGIVEFNDTIVTSLDPTLVENFQMPVLVLLLLFLGYLINNL